MKIWAGLITGIFGMSAAWVVILLLQMGRPTLSSQWIADVYAAKTVRAVHIQGRRIVVVAGSNALFGIDSKMLEQAYDLPVVNFAVNAGLMLPYVLLKSQAVLRPGDIVLLPLEYHFYVYDGIPNTQMIDQIWSRDPHFLQSLTVGEQWRMIWMISLNRVMEGFRAAGGVPTMCGPYGHENIDDHGDQTHTSAEEAKAWASDWEALKTELPRRYGAQAEQDQGWWWLRRYVRWAREQGIHLIFLPPAMMADPSYRHDPVEARFYTTLADRVRTLGVAFVGEPYSSMYPREWFFNTDHHLIDQARTRHTRRIIEALGPDLSRHQGME
jgi:hypothetical protein